MAPSRHPAATDRSTDRGADPAAAVAAAEDALVRLMRQASRPSFYRWIQAASGVSLDRSAYATLIRVAELGPARLTDLAEALGLDISTLSRQVRALERSGMIQRSSDPSDQRAFRLSLTAAGEETLRRTRQARQAALGRMLAGWSAADIAQLAELMDRFTEVIGTLAGADAELLAAEAAG